MWGSIAGIAITAVVGIAALVALDTSFFEGHLRAKRPAILLAITMIVVASFIQALSAWPKDPNAICSEYGITIDKPVGGYVSQDGTATIQGTYVRQPPSEFTQLFVVTTGNEYWPAARPMTFFEQTQTWEGEVFGEEDYSVMVVILDDNGKILTDYFLRASSLTGRPVPLTSLPAATAKCPSADVRVGQ